MENKIIAVLITKENMDKVIPFLISKGGSDTRKLPIVSDFVGMKIYFEPDSIDRQITKMWSEFEPRFVDLLTIPEDFMPIIPAEKRYPELHTIAKTLAADLIPKINYTANKAVSECPYKAQCVLELLIKELEKSV